MINSKYIAPRATITELSPLTKNMKEQLTSTLYCVSRKQDVSAIFIANPTVGKVGVLFYILKIWNETHRLPNCS